MGMGTERFFDETTDQSVVKATIVEKYFDTWAKIICGAQDHHRPGGDNRIGYVDLFAGPGRYKDGAISTPVRVLEKALSDQQLSARLVTIFNDRDPEHASTLRQVIKELSDVSQVLHVAFLSGLYGASC